MYFVTALLYSYYIHLSRRVLYIHYLPLTVISETILERIQYTPTDENSTNSQFMKTSGSGVLYLYLFFGLSLVPLVNQQCNKGTYIYRGFLRNVKHSRIFRIVPIPLGRFTNRGISSRRHKLWKVNDKWKVWIIDPCVTITSSLVNDSLSNHKQVVNRITALDTRFKWPYTALV